MLDLDRRAVLKGGALAAGGAALAPLAVPVPAVAAVPESPFRPTPMPAWAPFREGVAAVNGAELYFRDSGGDGTPLVLLHPATGSAHVWGYQQAAFVAAGYRVVAYSRRGYSGSAPADREAGGHPSEDLAALADHLGIGRFAIVASAAGCTITLDFAMSFPQRPLALVVSGGSYGRLREADYVARQVTDVEGFDAMPAYFRELGPAYRAADPEGTRAWAVLEASAVNVNRRGPTDRNDFTWATLAGIAAPTLFVAGGADLYSPPPLMAVIAGRVPGATLTVLPDVGHSAYWELPEAFNRTVLAFLDAHRG